MPSRIVREDILTSDPVNSLSWGAEVFYRRLMSRVDDYGRYVADLRILRAALYPLQLHKVIDSDIGKWLSDVTRAGLVSVYEVAGKRYVEVRKFDQRLRQKTSIYPPSDGCPSSDGHMTASGGNMLTDDSNAPPESESETEVLSVQNSKSSNSVSDKPKQTTHQIRLADEEFLTQLRATGAYNGIDLDAELRKMRAWLLTPKGRGRKLTRQFAVNWLNRVDKPLQLGGNLERSPPKRAKL